MSFVDIVVWPFARLLEVLYNWTSSYGLAIILFALVVNLILLPFMAKSKKGIMKTTRIQPQLKELEKNKLEAENSEIVDIVRGMSISLTELPLLFEKLKDGGTLGQSVPKSEEEKEEN